MWQSNRERGSATQAIIFSALVLVVILVLIGFRTLRSQFANRQIRDDATLVQLNGAIETALLVMRLAEIKYVDGVNKCNTAKPFLRALKEGSGCSGVTLTFFSDNDEGSIDQLYTYTGSGCTVEDSYSSCGAGGRSRLFQIGGGGPETKLNGSSFEVYLTAINVPKQIIEMMAEVTTSDNRKFKNQFAIRSTNANSAHLESDGRVVQEQPDPLSKCPGTQWADYLVFNPSNRKCERFSQLGSGTGLAFFSGRYFGFRPADGQVIDLLAASSTSSYLVEENGTLGGKALFPKYSRDALRDVDDITISSGQILYVRGLGEDAEIGLLKPLGSSWARESICSLGAQGWSQAYVGIAALATNQPLYPLPTVNGMVRISQFFLKTDSGDLLVAVVRARDTGYECSVFKEQALQQVEFKRSLGFDRAHDSRPYFLY
jgi:hypothetical protein